MYWKLSPLYDKPAIPSVVSSAHQNHHNTASSMQYQDAREVTESIEMSTTHLYGGFIGSYPEKCWCNRIPCHAGEVSIVVATCTHTHTHTTHTPIHTRKAHTHTHNTDTHAHTFTAHRYTRTHTRSRMHTYTHTHTIPREYGHIHTQRTHISTHTHTPQAMARIRVVSPSK